MYVCMYTTAKYVYMYIGCMRSVNMEGLWADVNMRDPYTYVSVHNVPPLSVGTYVCRSSIHRWFQ